MDYRGDLKRADPDRFPHGLEPLVDAMQRAGVGPGLWIDSSMVGWSIGGNPDVQACLNYHPDHPESVSQVSWGRVSFCRASEPIRSMYADAFREHVRDRRVRLLKFDNFATTCVNPRHGHLPGIYSTEPIIDSVIDFLHQLDAESPDIFLMLYWGYRSPWWLLHGDTLFDSGLGIEGASPSSQPAPHARDSITQKLDQAQRHASDVPALGKDSLGVWLSDWSWNSQVGPARWPEGMVMDICRGSLLAQPWAGREQLSDAEWHTMADLLALLRAQPQCFAYPRFILGDPFRNAPYGYACTDGKRAFLALNNCAWHDTRVELRLNHEWGLPDGRRWDLYRCYPDPARLEPPAEPFGERVSLALRPFEVVLLEAVPRGERPSLARPLPDAALPTAFPEPSAAVKLSVERPAPPEPVTEDTWHLLAPDRAVSTGGTVLEPQPDGSLLARGASPDSATYTIALRTPLAGLTGLRVEALPDDSLPGHGPGRAVNGNFALRHLSVTIAPAARPDEAQPVALVHPQASYEQTGYGGWPVAAAVDGDPRTGWSIDPHEGRRQVGHFEFAAPVGAAGGSVLTVTLEMGDRQHTLGRLRLAVTTAPAPLPPPPGDVLVPFVLTGVLPASAAGGMVVVSARLPGGPHPPEYGNLGSEFEHQGLLEGRPAAWEPVLGQATYPSCWQAWRLAVPPAAKARRFTLRIETELPLEVPASFAAWWLPR
ncbi:MAG: hypothetical protein HYU66_04170 [Armatimonadetes bacterium]|nr:hypothetical protein [Armatimonadota bacterium]